MKNIVHSAWQIQETQQTVVIFYTATIRIQTKFVKRQVQWRQQGPCPTNQGEEATIYLALVDVRVFDGHDLTQSVQQPSKVWHCQLRVIEARPATELISGASWMFLIKIQIFQKQFLTLQFLCTSNYFPDSTFIKYGPQLLCFSFCLSTLQRKSNFNNDHYYLFTYNEAIFMFSQMVWNN